MRNPPGRDILYLDDDEDTDYENLDDLLIVLCVDISGSMSVTSEVPVTFITDIPSCCFVVALVLIKYIFLSDLSR